MKIVNENDDMVYANDHWPNICANYDLLSKKYFNAHEMSCEKKCVLL